MLHLKNGYYNKITSAPIKAGNYEFHFQMPDQVTNSGEFTVFYKDKNVTGLEAHLAPECVYSGVYTITDRLEIGLMYMNAGKHLKIERSDIRLFSTWQRGEWLYFYFETLLDLLRSNSIIVSSMRMPVYA